MSARAGTLARRSFAALALLACCYLLAGQLLVTWTDLHFDGWAAARNPDPDRRASEWARVSRTVEAALPLWPWKTSLHLSAARLQLFGGYNGHAPPGEAGMAALGHLDTVHAQSTLEGEQLVLEIEAWMLARDPEAMLDAVRELRRVAPAENHFWRQLMVLATSRALSDVGLRPVVREIVAHYTQIAPGDVAWLAHRVVAVRVFLPPGFDWRAELRAWQERRARASTTR